MIVGVVTSSREAVIPLTLHLLAGSQIALDAVIDTGFTSALALPSTLIEEAGLTWRGQEPAILADGSERLFDIYEALVEWDGATRRVLVLAADGGPLVGMALLKGYEITIRAVPGGAITIRALP